MTPEETAISKLRDRAGWYCGDARAREVLAEYRASVTQTDQAEAERLRTMRLELQAREVRV